MLKSPQQVFSFTDWAKNRPREPIPGDRLDMQFAEIIRAIQATQRAIADIRADDGKLKRGIVTDDQLTPRLRDRLISDITGSLEPIRASIRGTYTSTVASEQQAELYAQDAERAAIVASQLTVGMEAIRQEATAKSEYAAKVWTKTDADARSADNSANWATAQADNAELAANLALQWAEYLAGPVVDSTQAPAYIASSPFPHGLYYQPVEGGLAGLWSAKWWALYAQQLVGKGAFYYLGAWTAPPVPGGINPITGQRVPDPLSPGSLYYDLNTNTLYVWNGSSWAQQQLLTAGYTSEYIYIAAAGQAVFSGPDSTGKTPTVGAGLSRVHVNGLLLAPSQYTVDAAASSLTLGSAPPAGAPVIWDLLAPPPIPGAVNAFKVINLNPDGSRTGFPVQYVDPGTGHAADVVISTATQLIVCQDGVLQEPGGDYTVTTTGSASTLHMNIAPPADAHFWAVVLQSGRPSTVPPGSFVLGESTLGGSDTLG